jgi:hypothetical protein
MIDTRMLGRKDIEFLLQNLKDEEISIVRYDGVLNGVIKKKENDYLFFPNDRKMNGIFINLKGVVINLIGITTIHSNPIAEEKAMKLLTLKNLFKVEKDFF